MSSALSLDRRGKRPATPERLAVARSFNNAATISALPFVQAGGDESNALRRDLEHPDSASDGTDCDGDMDGMELPSSIQQQKLLHADALDQDNWGLEDGRPLQHSMGAPHPDAAARFTINVTPSDAQPPTAGISSLLTSEEVIQLRSLLGGATSQHPFQLELHQENITNIPNSEQSTVLPSDPPTLQEHSNSNIGHLAPTDARLGAFGSGLVDRLIALEDAGAGLVLKCMWCTRSVVACAIERTSTDRQRCMSCYGGLPANLTSTFIAVVQLGRPETTHVLVSSI